jgi:hypothetical protein
MELKRLTSIITSRLAYLSSEVRLSGSMNLLDSNVLLEDVFKEILNITYGLKLQNANLIKQNIRAIDLIDCSSKTIIQVSSDNSKAKVQTSLDKIELPKYDGYTFKFVCISKGVSHLKKHHFNVPEGISFNAETDCYDDKRILRDILAKDIDTIRKLASYLEESILPATADERRPSVITYVINRLADEPLAEIAVNPDTKSFDLEPKIDFNSLKKWRDIISEYTVFSLLVDKIYRAYDEQGVNKSFAVLSSLHDLYLNLASELTGDALFDKLLESVYDIVNKDYEYNESLTREELQMNIKIVLVDAFVKCKIFKKPE